MSRINLLALAVALAPMAAMSPLVAAPAAAEPAKPVYSTADTDLGTLLDNPATKAVLVKYIPATVANPQIDMARSMTLKQMQSYAADTLTDATLAKIDTDLAKIPAPK